MDHDEFGTMGPLVDDHPLLRLPALGSAKLKRSEAPLMGNLTYRIHLRSFQNLEYWAPARIP